MPIKICKEKNGFLEVTDSGEAVRFIPDDPRNRDFQEKVKPALLKGEALPGDAPKEKGRDVNLDELCDTLDRVVLAFIDGTGLTSHDLPSGRLAAIRKRVRG